MKTIWLSAAFFLLLISFASNASSEDVSLEPVLEAWESALDTFGNTKIPQVDIHDEAAKALAESLGKDGLSYLKAVVPHLRNPSDTGNLNPLRVAMRAMARLDAEQAVETLLVLADDKEFAWFAAEELSEIDSEKAKDALEQIAQVYSNQQVINEALSGLRWLGDKDTAAMLANLAKSKLYKDSSKWLLFAAKTIEYRFSLPTVEEQKRWQSYHKALRKIAFYPGIKNGPCLSFLAQERRKTRKGKYPFEFLRQYIEDAPEPSCMAIYLMGVQKEQNAVPLLQKYSKDEGYAGECARETLKILSPQ